MSQFARPETPSPEDPTARPQAAVTRCGPSDAFRLGADPATASSIFLTTATAMTTTGLFAALATWLVL